jgi:hypothetical protein
LEFSAQRQRVVRFHRGGNFGAAREQLTSGVYVFQATSEGWRLTQRETLPVGAVIMSGETDSPSLKTSQDQ